MSIGAPWWQKHKRKIILNISHTPQDASDVKVSRGCWLAAPWPTRREGPVKVFLPWGPQILRLVLSKACGRKGLIWPKLEDYLDSIKESMNWRHTHWCSMGKGRQTLQRVALGHKMAGGGWCSLIPHSVGAFGAKEDTVRQGTSVEHPPGKQYSLPWCGTKLGPLHVKHFVLASC